MAASSSFMGKPSPDSGLPARNGSCKEAWCQHSGPGRLPRCMLSAKEDVSFITNHVRQVSVSRMRSCNPYDSNSSGDVAA